MSFQQRGTDPEPKNKNMKPIKITIANNAVLNAALDAVNGKAQTFTIRNGAEVVAIAKEFESMLDMLPKDQRKGASASYKPAGPSANSYKYSAKSTRILLERRSSDWWLVGVIASTVEPKRPAQKSIQITRAQADEIATRALAKFSIKQEDLATA